MMNSRMMFLLVLTARVVKSFKLDGSNYEMEDEIRVKTPYLMEKFPRFFEFMASDLGSLLYTLLMGIALALMIYCHYVGVRNQKIVQDYNERVAELNKLCAQYQQQLRNAELNDETNSDYSYESDNDESNSHFSSESSTNNKPKPRNRSEKQ